MASFNNSSSSDDSVVEIPAPPPREIEVITIDDDGDEPSLLFGDETMDEITNVVGEVDDISFDWSRIDAEEVPPTRAEEVPPSRMGTPPNNASSDLVNMDDAVAPQVDVVQMDTPFIVVREGDQLFLVPVDIANKPPTPPPSPPHSMHDLPIIDSFSSSIFDSLNTTPSGLFDSTPSHDSGYLEFDVTTECPPDSPHPSFSPISVCNYNTRHAGHTPGPQTPLSLVHCYCPFCDGLALPIVPPQSPNTPPARTPTPPNHPLYSPYTDGDDIVFLPSRTSTPQPNPVVPAPAPAADSSSDSSPEIVRRAIRRGRRNVRPSPMVPRPSSRLRQVIRRLNFDDEHQAGPSHRQAGPSSQPEPLPESTQPGPSRRQSPQPEPARQIPASPVSRLSRRVFVDREMPRALNQLNLLVEWQNQFLLGLGRRIRSAERQEMLRRFAELDIVAFRLNLYFRDFIDRLEGNPTSSADSDNEE